MNAVTQIVQDGAEAPLLLRQVAPPPLVLVEPVAAPPRAIAAGTAIATPTGPCAAERLKPGDRVTTRDGATVAIRTVRIHTHSLDDLHRHPEIAPIRIEPGALPGSELAEALLVSPDQHVPLPDAGGAECLLPARALCDGGGIRRVIPAEGIAFVELTCDEPQLLNAGGLWIETGEFTGAPRMTRRSAQVPVSDRRVFTPL